MHSVVQKGSFKFWFRIALFNLLLVAAVGVLLRYKMVASLPWVNHKFVLHGHSHFAFAGWISLAIMTAILYQLYLQGVNAVAKHVYRILPAQVVCAYGMLLTFPWQGYAPLSISFSTASIFVSYIFAGSVWKYCKASTMGQAASVTLRSALLFFVISSFGAFWLAGLMVTQSSSQPLYFSALYFFLHFQYNGWFFFGILGLLFARIHAAGIPFSKPFGTGLWMLVIACLPAVLLSGLWMKLPFWVYGVSALVAVIQLMGTGMMLAGIEPGHRYFLDSLPPVTRQLFILSFIAFLIRIVLQALSTIPSLSKFAFAYRPVVIGYLHLILLGCISLFLLGYLFTAGIWRPTNKWVKAMLTLFLCGFFVTEFTLMFQGFGFIGWVSIPYISECLFMASILMFIGIAGLNYAAQNKAIPR